ncbi:MAG TPA: nitroreductase [Rhodobacteraceae bacterium]|nr:nitroreductase [Paracoccaceae bacterium]
MPKPDPAALNFLLNRRSRPAKTLRPPVPTREQLLPILTAAARTPDHGKLEPWRFLVLEKQALDRLAKLAEARGRELGLDEQTIEKGVSQYSNGELAIAVIATPARSEKVPEIEQIFSAGAACLACLNAALASGWGANWLTGWASHDRDFVEEGLGLKTFETVAGLIFLGTEAHTPPERPRPDLEQIVTWVSE